MNKKKHHKPFWEYDKDEADICLNCTKKKCMPNCARYKTEKKKLKNNKKGV